MTKATYKRTYLILGHHSRRLDYHGRDNGSKLGAGVVAERLHFDPQPRDRDS